MRNIRYNLLKPKILKYSSKNPTIGCPWWFNGKEFACQCRGHRFDPRSGKIPHAMEQLSPWATTTEPVLWSLGTEPQLPEPTSPRALAQQQEPPPQ